MKNKIPRNSLHPFQILFDGERICVHRGVVVNVETAEIHEVIGATQDLRYEEPSQFFTTDVDINVKLVSSDPSNIDPDESVSVSSANISIGPRNVDPQSIFLGTVSNGVIEQNLRSDIYTYIAGAGVDA